MGKGGGGGSGVGRTGIQAAMGYWSPTVKPRNMLFRQMASALATGGGKGFKMPFVQQAMARSRAAGTAALAGARESMSGVDPNIRGRILNRMALANRQSTAQIAPRTANELIAKAPAFIANSGSSAVPALGVAASSEEAAMQAAAARAAGFSSMAAGAAAPLGTAVGTLVSPSDSSSKINPYTSRPGATFDPAVINARANQYNANAAAASNPGWFARFFGGARG